VEGELTKKSLHVSVVGTERFDILLKGYLTYRGRDCAYKNRKRTSRWTIRRELQLD